jgi:hypothetical protein
MNYHMLCFNEVVAIHLENNGDHGFSMSCGSDFKILSSNPPSTKLTLCKRRANQFECTVKSKNWMPQCNPQVNELRLFLHAMSACRFFDVWDNVIIHFHNEYHIWNFDVPNTKFSAWHLVQSIAQLFYLRCHFPHEMLNTFNFSIDNANLFADDCITC